MAPTLYGQHRDVICDQCGFRFSQGIQVTAGDDGDLVKDSRDGGVYINSDGRAHTAICPNCRYPQYVLEDQAFPGDRIFVNKFPYEFAEPQRWDVVVFKYPLKSNTNYIKRLVGLPNEQLRIEGGDIFVRPLGSEEPFRVARKSPSLQKQVQIPVYDDRHPPRALLAAGWPERWLADEPEAWTLDVQRRSYTTLTAAENADWQHLTYRNQLPSPEHWMQALNTGRVTSLPGPLLISDFYAYNARVSLNSALHQNVPRTPEPNATGGLRLADLEKAIDNQWVSDLTVSGKIELLDIPAAGGGLLFEIVEGPRRLQCLIDVATGRGEFATQPVTGSANDRELLVDFETPVKGPRGSFQFRFSNVDDRLCLWIDDVLVRQISFDPETKFLPPARPIQATAADLEPVSLAVSRASVRFSELLLERDIYYRAAQYDAKHSQQYEEWSAPDSQTRMRELLSDPAHWTADYVRRHRVAEFNVGSDEFFVLGDNSPRSSDSRLWRSETPVVPRRLMIGKAMYVFWPHGVPFMNDGAGLFSYKYRASPGSTEPSPPIPYFSLPFYPQFGRMQRIR